MIRAYIAKPTKRGHPPTDRDLMRFMMLCKERQLNPWTNDAYLVGYDSDDGPEFSLITSYEALLKRAELNPHYQGMAGGVVVKGKAKNSQPIEREGSIVYDGEALLGAWARVKRDDRQQDAFASVKFSAYNTGRSYWKKNPSWMIVKVAKAAGLREAFPSQCGGLYTADEMGDYDTMAAAAAGFVVNSAAAAGHQRPDEAEAKPVDKPQQQLDQLKAELAARQKQAQQESLPEDLSQKPPEDASVVPGEIQDEEPDNRPGEPPEDYDGPSEDELDDDSKPPYSTDEPFELE